MDYRLHGPSVLNWTEIFKFLLVLVRTEIVWKIDEKINNFLISKVEIDRQN